VRIYEVRALSQEDLEKELQETYKESLSVRFRLSTRQLSDTSQQKKVRNKIARIKTVLRERQLLEQAK
jgi:large subunit ribosomal protein L29